MTTSRYWDLEEDKVLWEAMREHGSLTKEQIPLLVPRKTLNQCRNRIKQLRSQGGPTIRSRPHNWSAEDDQKLLELVVDETICILTLALIPLQHAIRLFIFL